MVPVFLIGFMGAGKTTLAKKLSLKLGAPHIDLDQFICGAAGYQTVADLVSAKGMDTFRELERKALRVSGNGAVVLSTGGGTPCFFDNMLWMKNNGLTVYIRMSDAALFSRLQQTDAAERPLLAGKDEKALKQYITETMALRRPFYESADLIFDPFQEDIESLIKKIGSYTR